MEFSEVLKNRFSCRSFLPRKVPRKYLRKILKAGTLAPSAGNTQDWRFCVVEDEKLKEKLAEASLGQDFLKEASAVIVVCSDLREIAERYGERGRNLYAYQDTAAAIENMLLQATDLGLATCWVGAFAEDKVKQILGLLPEVQPVALIAVGYPKEKPLGKFRKKLSEVLISWQ
ncbi:nitroreductase family protein [bacterium]|nr:nitroreductase family protein [bacterium]